eukprot:m.173568 g.173568  ORF g.173568 m.173568 type:complete len:50 (+) comp53271_c2_seq4:279-428(+)
MPLDHRANIVVYNAVQLPPGAQFSPVGGFLGSIFVAFGPTESFSFFPHQ